MTKATKYFIAAAVALLTLAGCDDNEPENNGGKESPDFTATIGSVQSRAYDNTWENGDQIGISGGGKSNISHSTKNGDGAFSVVDSKDQIYFKDDNEVSFTAYYPWTELTGGATQITADTKAQDNQKNFDFLWADEAKGSKEKPSVKFTFSHKMAKVVLTVSKGSNMTDGEFQSTRLSLSGISHSGTFNIANGSTTVGEPESDWKFATAPLSKSYTFIFFPQELTGPLGFLAEIQQDGGSNTQLKGEIDFTEANMGKDGASAKNELVAGRQYNLSVTLQKTGVVFSNCIINDWDSTDEKEIPLE